jgi:hypothetical protein
MRLSAEDVRTYMWLAPEYGKNSKRLLEQYLERGRADPIMALAARHKRSPFGSDPLSLLEHLLFAEGLPSEPEWREPKEVTDWNLEP